MSKMTRSGFSSLAFSTASLPLTASMAASTFRPDLRILQTPLRTTSLSSAIRIRWPGAGPTETSSMCCSKEPYEGFRQVATLEPLWRLDSLPVEN